jgi:hypothetical protein
MKIYVCPSELESFATNGLAASSHDVLKGLQIIAWLPNDCFLRAMQHTQRMPLIASG